MKGLIGMTVTMDRTLRPLDKALPARGDSGHIIEVEQPVRILGLHGRHDLAGLLYQGMVRLYDIDGTVVELWDPENIGDPESSETGRNHLGYHRVHLAIRLSEEMRERCYNRGKPSPPDNPMTTVSHADYIHPRNGYRGDRARPRMKFRCGFNVLNWGWLALDIERAELIVPDNDDPAPVELLHPTGVEALGHTSLSTSQVLVRYEVT